MQRGHKVPTCDSAGIAREGKVQRGREFTLGFHGGEKLLGDLLGAADAGDSALWLINPVGEPFARGIVQRGKPGTEGGGFGEDALEFGGDGDEALFDVGFEEELRCRAFGRVSSSLHFFIHEQKVFALAGGKKRGAKGEAVDFAPDLETAAAAPNFVDVEGNPNNNPAEIGAEAHERGFERFFDELLGWLEFWFGFRFHCGAVLNARDFSMSDAKERVTFLAEP